jgi:hypothetical protein
MATSLQQTGEWVLRYAGPVFAFYVFVEGLLRGYELFTGHHLAITDNSNALLIIGVLGNVLFGAHFLYSAWESRHITAGAVVLGLVLAGIYGAYVSLSNLPEQGREWMRVVEEMPVGTIFKDPYSNEWMVKESWGVRPLDGPFDVNP